MRPVVLFFLFFTPYILAKETINFNVEWGGSVVYEISKISVNLPDTKNFKIEYSIQEKFKLINQWSESKLIDPKSVEIRDVKYSTIDIKNFSGLDKIIFPNDFNVNLNSSISKNQILAFLEITPIIFSDGTYKKIENFSVSYDYLKKNKKLKTSIESSKLSSGNWYKFYINNTGIHKIDKEFLNDLGINTNNIDPKKIKIFSGKGGMLSLQNQDDFPTDPIENTIKIVGEEDGVFDSEDYILFYGIGPEGYNDENDTNLNLYENNISYFISIGTENGLRLNQLIEPEGNSDLNINYYTNYKFYEVDEYNLAKIGRRWFGDRFDFENIKNYQFELDDLITEYPVSLRLYAAATSEISTSMSINLNNSPITTLVFGSIGDPILASGAGYSNEINVNSSTLNVSLDYNNNGNPSSSAYLDYISLEGRSFLNFNGGQLLFQNKNLEKQPEIVTYEIGNALNVKHIWNVSDNSNIFELTSSESNMISFKSFYSESNKFIAFDESFYFEPFFENEPEISNQNLKEEIFFNDQNLIEPIDYLIIARSDMILQAERLAEINRVKNNLNVKVVDVEKIYNEFSSGNQDISAIRNFVRYVYSNENNENSLKYLCLFGDASFDYKDRIPNNTNIIPSWHSLNSFSLSSSYISDDFFGMMDFNEGSMTSSNKLDIAVGRILADSNQKAIDLIDKIESYYSQDSYGDWRNRIIVISDDVDEPWENIIQSTSNNIADLITQNKPFFNTKKILIDAFNQETSSGGERYPEVNNQIINGMKQGALVINYFGHGGEDGLARERIFDKIDAAEINNNNKFNCFVSVTCEFTKFDNPNRDTAGEFLYWNKYGGSIALITTTRQIFVSVGVNFNLTLENYLFSLNSDNYTSMAEALRLTKTDLSISNSDQRRLVFFIGDPAMKLAIPKPDINITKINDIMIQDFDSSLRGLDLVKISGEMTNSNGSINDLFQGELIATVFDKEINRSTLANDGTTDNSGNPIILNFNTLGEVLFRGKSTITDGLFELNFVIPKDVGMQVDYGKFSFYAKENNNLNDKNGYDLSVLIGGINENAEEDNLGPEIDLFMNDESFVSGGITNENPNLIVKLFDLNGINTSSGVGHDIIAVLDNDDTKSFRLNEYYQANLDDYQNGTVNFPLNNLVPGLHTLRLKAWDVYNNSSESEIEFIVFDEDQDLVIENLLNYPNPFINYTEFWFNHNSSTNLNVTIQVFTISGRLVKTINGITDSSGNTNFSRDFSWDGRDDFGDKVAKGVYIYKLTIRSESVDKNVSKIEKLVIL
ncbi:MAG: peptidase C25 [Flavobacteriaceae bacterium]|nr:peptidase C25 [Flavobacteriaceae bacterium]|tara:strand:+ start:14439 stop:18266 length:3828 start_codon:yes stop_codon:yes gene_type:complete